MNKQRLIQRSEEGLKNLLAEAQQPLKFTIGQTVYYPALILGHDGAVSKCEVQNLRLTHLQGFLSVCADSKGGEHTKYLDRYFPTRSEALAKLRAKLETRIGYLNQALNSLHNQP